MKETRKQPINKKIVKNIAGVLSQVFAMAMALILALLAQRYVVLHENYGSYMISPYENSGDFQDTQTFHMVFQRELMTLSHYLALCSQLEEDGEYNPDRRVDVFEYVERKDTSTLQKQNYPKLVYRIGDLIEWTEYGIGINTFELPYEEAKQYLSEEELRRYYEESTGIRIEDLDLFTEEEITNPSDFFYPVNIVDEEFKPQNVSSIYDLELPEGVTLEDVVAAIQETAHDLNVNYLEYVEKKEKLSADSNFKYMYVNSLGQVQYTNLENKEGRSVEELAEAFTNCKTYMIYDYAENELISNNLLADHEPYYKGYFRDYKYCFPKGGKVYAAIQTQSSSAFGALNTDDFYATANANLTKIDASWEQMLALAAVFAMLSLIALIVFIIFQPKKKRDELRYFDAMFTEIAVILAFATAWMVIAVGGFTAIAYVERDMPVALTSEQYSQGFVMSIFVTFVIVYLMFLLYMGSLVRRIKAKALWKGSLCYYLLHNTKKICNKMLAFIGKVVGALVNHKHFMVRTFGPYCLFLFVNVVLILMFREFGLFLDIVFDVAVAVYLYFEYKAREEIVQGITRICDGDVTYQIDSSHFYGENKVMADAVNRIGEAVNKAVQISMKDERLKADLITNVSHDIKTPLTSIINYVDLLKRENIQGEKAQEYIRILDEKSQRLKQLTLDLVEASKISSGNITLEMGDIDVKELLNQALGEYKDKMEEKQLTLVESYPQQEKPMIYADSRRMWRVVENLLVNICKYSMEGTRVYVDVAVTDAGLAGAGSAGAEHNDIGTNSSVHSEMVEMTFKNISAQPLNIPAEELTERFIRGDVSRSTEGSGLGLSIAKNLTVAQGGEFNIFLDGDLFKVVVRFPKK